MDYPNWIEKAEELYKKKYSFSKIGEELKVNRKLVSYYLQAKGYEPNHKYMSKTKVMQKTQKNINEKIFENIDTEEKAYWLGMLMADGNVDEKRNSIELCLKEEDYEHICKFKDFLGSDHKIGKKTKHDKKYNKDYVSYRLGFRSIKIKQDLMKLGCTPRKSKTLEFPIIPNNLIRHFIRGYFDGDGCVRKGTTTYISLEILGTEQFLREITDYFNIDEHIHSFKHSDVKRFCIAGNEADKILSHLYKDSTIYLERKYLKYCRLTSTSIEEVR